VKIVLIVLGLLGIATTLLPLLRFDSWWIRIFDFPRLQITLTLALALALYLIFVWPTGAPEITFWIALAGCLAYQGYMMFPYTRLAKLQVQRSRRSSDDPTLSLLFANVLQDNRNAEGLKQIVKDADPDILLTVETDDWWAKQLEGFKDTYPYFLLQPQDDTYGMLLYSKLKLIDATVKFLVEDNVPSIHARVELRSGKTVEIRCLHPPPPFPTVDEQSTERDAELLLVGKELKKHDGPAIVFGDLNDVAWSRTNYLFQDISGLLDPRVGRGFYNTFHAKYPFLRFPLDHCFHSNDFRLVDFRLLPYYGSDHFPVFIKLSYEPDAPRQQEELQADRSQEKEADEKIEKKVG
jgi:endonuclease/exonuclease/phosphatase (EEP) superfamily protein YafD